MNIRDARADDGKEASQLILHTLGNSGDVLFGNGSVEKARILFERMFSSRGNRFSYQYAFCFEMEEMMAGLLVAFPGDIMIRLLLNTGFQLLWYMGFLNFLGFLMIAFPLRNEENIHRDEFFISHLAVFPDFQRQGIGWDLLKFAQFRARDLNYQKLALNVDIDNIPAIALYKKFGFDIVSQTIYPESTQKKINSRGSLKMVKDISEE